MALQWFISILEHKERFLQAGREVAWYPAYMHARYDSWVTNLAWDWSISRQRACGVPFPVWYCRDCGAVVAANRDQLPIDPTAVMPTAPCRACGGAELVPETDVMDTWATSSLTPRICASLAEELYPDDVAAMQRFLPMSLRPNAHDIIRTWDFYTIVRSLFHDGHIPWHAVMIAGHALNPVGKKISKSKLQTATDPLPIIERFSADAVRYWTAGARTGADTILTDHAVESGEAFRQGNRLVTKLWNAARFVLLHGDEPASADACTPTPADRWLLSQLGRTIVLATNAFEQYELSSARAAVEAFFWSDFCDIYLELVKYRVTHATGAPGKAAAIHAMRAALLAVLKMLAPFVPHVTEEIYLQGFAASEGSVSIHVTAWPDASAYQADEEAERLGSAVLSIVGAVRRWKAERSMSVGAPLNLLQVSSPPEQLPLLQEIEPDLRSITRAGNIVFGAAETLTVIVDNADLGYLDPDVFGRADEEVC